MTREASDAILAALPGADPYQAAARLALARILYATENAETQCEAVGVCLGFFLEDPPLSLAFDSPAASAELCAKRLEALAREIRKGVKVFRDLTPYVAQFDSVGVSDGRPGQIHRGEREIPPEGPDPCPF